ncbi:MAG TPA: L-threonylcarbamoyladenylate synthase [Bacilli bacterium]|nr:L-threonylcarbamoyladenylate synthase [Bacilli bacterium]
MKTTIYNQIDLQNTNVQHHIKDVIQSGGIVVFPTETVYGIGANALDKNAAKKVYEVKGRPSDNPLIVHIEKPEDLSRYVEVIPDDANGLIKAFWPGPLTIIFQKRDIIPTTITGGLNTVAIRCPSNPIANAVIKFASTPLCAPSANISGKPSSTLFEHVVDDMMGKVDVIIDGGKSQIGLESTVLDLTSEEPTILRPGFITRQMIETVLNKSVLDKSVVTPTEVPKSPGMKYKHYAPSGVITVLYGKEVDIINYINTQLSTNLNVKIGVICSTELYDKIQTSRKFDIGSMSNDAEVASNLFIALRKMDELGVDIIYTHAFSELELGNATMNRLLKASSYNIKKV